MTKKEVKRKNQDALDSLLDPPIAFNPSFLRITHSPAAAIFLGQSWYWTKIHSRNGGDGWWYNSQIEIEEQTGLSRSNQLTARRILKDLGIQDEKLQGVPATLHFKIDKMRVYELLGFQFAESRQTEDIQFAESQQTSLQDPGKLDSRESANKIAETQQSLIVTKTPTKNLLEYTKKGMIQKIKFAIENYIDKPTERVRVCREIENLLVADTVSMYVDEGVVRWVGLNGNSEILTSRYKKILDNVLILDGLSVEFCE